MIRRHSAAGNVRGSFWTLWRMSIAVPPGEADLEVTADDSKVTETMLYFNGNVSVQQGYRSVTADAVETDRQNETAVASAT